MALVKEYLELTNQYKKEYGEKTLILMEVGSFFEVYALINPDGTYTGSNIEEFAKMNEMVIATKNIFVGKFPVAMAGVGTAYADKYIHKLQEHGYTIVVYRQESENKTSRKLSEIISPGTYFPAENENDLDRMSNNVMCIWLHKFKATKTMPCQVTIGLANIDIYTGKTALFQFTANYSHSPATYDELERYISAYRPSECLVVANMAERLIDDIVGFVGLDQAKLHKVDTSSASSFESLNKDNKAITSMETYAKNAEKQIYQVEVLKKFFPHLSSFHEMFPTHSIAIQSFCFLLDFVYQHSPNLVKRLSEPVFENYTDRLILSNHTLNQLNIIDDNRHKGRLRSVSSLLNNCVTTMGKRQFMYNLHYPITHVPTLQASYDITDHLLAQGEPYYLMIRNKLNTITDLEKFARRIITKKIMPKNLTTLAEDLLNIESLFIELKADETLNAYFPVGEMTIAAACRTIIDDLQRVFNLEVCRNLSEMNEINYIINKGISPLIDKLLKESMDGIDKLEAISKYLSDLVQQTEKKAAQYVKIHQTSKSNAMLVCTSRRAELLKTAVASLIQRQKKTTVDISYKSKYSNTDEIVVLNLSNLEYNTSSSSKTEKNITNKQISDVSRENEINKIKAINEMCLVFQNYISDFGKFEKELSHIIKYTTEMDMLQCKAYTAHKYNYCKPIISAEASNTAINNENNDKHSKSFFEFTGIRHPLIEHLQTNELYVTNDMALGKNPEKSVATNESHSENINGILLYGTNAVGKTSFIKSVGIAVIMAQAGLYVPCNSFIYTPYRNVFTRILGNDNLFKGLSTFAVEMTELRTILTMANAQSLVLGDELCSGTESDSALSIFMAGLEILHKKESTFLFATHFHEINNYDEVNDLTRMKMMHMAVHYNKETNVLIYDRKLREGPGESMYGLEVCKSLNLPDDFLQRAHDIRMKYHPEKKNVLSLSPTHFNAKKLVGNCEICEKHKASEVHHLQYQKNASPSNEYIANKQHGQNFHKNHVANLLNICETCHKKIHKSNEEYKVVKTSNGYMLSKI